jgi:hypothetical protein
MSECVYVDESKMSEKVRARGVIYSELLLVQQH